MRPTCTRHLITSMELTRELLFSDLSAKPTKLLASGFNFQHEDWQTFAALAVSEIKRY
ncbi:MAG: DUF1731 domain-containing protein [Deltaproteobacteria bacterium]|nr:DUF1731 domain-containing protein [Deltaproteobacteria bacterium]